MIKQLDFKQVQSNLDFICNQSYKILTLCSLVELIAFPSWSAIFCIFCSFVGIFYLKHTLLYAERLVYYPVSTIAILMYVLSFLLLPYPATLVEVKPVIYNLHNPYETFLNILLLEFILILSQSVYIKITGRKNAIRNILFKLPTFSALTSSELWFLIIVSFIFYVYVIMTMGLYNDVGENINRSLPPVLYVTNLLVSGFHSLIFIFFFRELGVIKDKNYKIHTLPIFAIAVILFIVGIATNMRTAAIEVVSIGVFIFVYYWFFYLSNKSFKLKSIVLVLFIVWFFFGPFMIISRTMVLVRQERYGLSGQDVLEMTFSGLKDKDNTEKSNSNIVEKGYSEKYLSNDILQRFCSVKILDETLYRSHQAGYANKGMNKHLMSTLESYCPGFLKTYFGLSQKEVKGSLTDKLAVESGSASFVGGVKIGTLQGLGLALYGWWWVPVVFLLYIVIFYLMDSTVGFHKGKMRFSWAFLMHVVAFCYWFSDRHYYVWEYRFLIRGYFEMIFFSCLTIWIVKKIPFLKH